MGRPRKGKTEPQEDVGPPAGQPPERTQPDTQPESEAASTVTIRFDPATGKPKPMQAETLERLRRALPHLGLSEEALGEEPPHRLLGPKFFDGLCTAITWSQGLLMEWFTGMPASDARKVLRYTEEEKNELREPALAVLDRELGVLWRRDPEAYAVIFVLVAIHIEKFARCVELKKKLDAGGANGGAHERISV